METVDGTECSQVSYSYPNPTSAGGPIPNTLQLQTDPAPGSVTAVGMATTPDDKRYWIARSDGSVQALGDAQSLGGVASPTPIVALASPPSGQAYWLVNQAGTVYRFGSATYHGNTSGLKLAKPIVAMAADPATGGYWLLGGNGGVFIFDALFYGSTGNITLARPAVGMAARPDGHGYYFVARDGGIFAYGDCVFRGSAASFHLARPVVGMALDPAPVATGWTPPTAARRVLWLHRRHHSQRSLRGDDHHADRRRIPLRCDGWGDLRVRLGPVLRFGSLNAR